MKTIAFVVACMFVPYLALCQSNTPASVLRTNSVTQAKQDGEARAKEDIAKGTLQILYYGIPWSIGKPLIDEDTGLPVKLSAGCDVTPEFVAETDAYNALMRQAAKEKKTNETANKVSEAIGAETAPHPQR